MTVPNRNPTPREYRAAALLRAGLRQFSQHTAHELTKHGLTPERYELLLAIKAGGTGRQGATVSELTTELGVAQSSMTQLVRRAEDAGLLRREVSSSDARVRHLRLTDEGETKLAGAVNDLRHDRRQLRALITEIQQHSP